MEELIESVPDIIRAAAASWLGIVALSIIAAVVIIVVIVRRRSNRSPHVLQR